jgi:hypothetical protein
MPKQPSPAPVIYSGEFPIASIGVFETFTKDKSSVVKELIRGELESIRNSAPDGTSVIGLSCVESNFDQLFVRTCNDLQIPWVAILISSSALWPRALPASPLLPLLRTARSTFHPSRDSAHSAKSIREHSRSLVVHGRLLLAYWDGGAGDTARVISCASNLPEPTPVRVLDPAELEHGWWPLHPGGAYPEEEADTVNQDPQHGG